MFWSHRWICKHKEKRNKTKKRIILWQPLATTTKSTASFYRQKLQFNQNQVQKNQIIIIVFNWFLQIIVSFNIHNSQYNRRNRVMDMESSMNFWRIFIIIIIVPKCIAHISLFHISKISQTSPTKIKSTRFMEKSTN